MEIITFTIPIGEEEAVFELHPLKRKACMKLTHRFIGALQQADSNVALIDFDLLEDFATQLFCKGSVRVGIETAELTNLEWFADKLDILYQAIAEAVQANNPSLFQRMGRI